MSNNLRSRVLSVFRSLHRARKEVFAGDDHALQAGRVKINDEFRKHQGETDEAEIEKLAAVGTDAAEYLRKMVVQAKIDDDTGNFKVRITKDTDLPINVPYDDSFVPPKRPSRRCKDR